MGASFSTVATMSVWIYLRHMPVQLGFHKKEYYSILTKNLPKRKSSARCVTRFLAVDQNHTRRTMSCANLNLLEADLANFLQRLENMDEMCVHHFTTEAKQQSKQWKHPATPPKTILAAGYVMADGILIYSKTCLKWPIKKDKTKVLKINGSLKKVESIAECALESFKGDNLNRNQGRASMAACNTLP